MYVVLVGGENVPKPSIFSNNYDKQMKRRKITIIMVVLAIIIILGFIISGILKKVNSKNKSTTKQKVETKVETKEVKKANNKNSVASHEERNEINSKNYNAKLSNGMEIKLIYNIVNNEKEYIKVEPDNIK